MAPPVAAPEQTAVPAVQFETAENIVQVISTTLRAEERRSKLRRTLQLDRDGRPLAALFLTVLAFNQLGDGLRNALDPALRR